MKKNLLLTALVSLTCCSVFFSCSDDDDNGSVVIPANQMRVTKISGKFKQHASDYVDGENIYKDIKYDEYGRVTEYVNYNSFAEHEYHYVITYYEDKIVVNENIDGFSNYSTTYNLHNGLIASDGYVNYYYDNDKRMVKLTDGYEEYNYEWINGNPVKTTCKYKDDEPEIEESIYTNFYNPLGYMIHNLAEIEPYFGNDLLSLSGYFGNAPVNLVEEGAGNRLSYKFNNNNYPIEISILYEDGGTFVYNLEWEEVK